MLAVVLCGCEVIPEAERLIPVETEPYGRRTHLLLEFTGFRCVNCPNATETALALQEVYGENLTVVALHPASNPFTQGLYDYTCPAADNIYLWMGGDASTPFPAGNLDMQIYEGEWFVSMSEWPTMVYQAMQDTIVTGWWKTAFWAFRQCRTERSTWHIIIAICCAIYRPTKRI